MFKQSVACLAMTAGLYFGMQTQSQARIIDPEQDAICKAMAEQVVSALGASITNRTDAMYSLSVGNFSDIKFMCDRTNSLRQFDGIEISYGEGGKPPEAWWTILGLAGEAYSGRAKADVIKEAQACLATAADDPFNTGQTTSDAIHIECNSGSKHGTSVYVRIYPEHEKLD